MTQVATFNVDGVRTARTDNGTRVYVGPDLIGTLDRRLFPGPRRRVWRWYVKPAAYAWTQARLDVPAPPAYLVQELPEPFGSRYAALVGLVDHLHAHGAIAVAPLFGAPRV
jgi:hypothetical protein